MRQATVLVRYEEPELSDTLDVANVIYVDAETRQTWEDVFSLDAKSDQ